MWNAMWGVACGVPLVVLAYGVASDVLHVTWHFVCGIWHGIWFVVCAATSSVWHLM